MDGEMLIKALPTILVGAGTYIGGLFTKPFEKWSSNYTDRRRLRNSLYAEFVTNLEQLFLHHLGLHQPAESRTELQPTIGQWERREVYDQALKTQPVLFHEIKEAKVFSEFYVALELLKAAPPEQLRAAISHHYEWLEYCLKKGRLSRRRIRKSWSLPGSIYCHPLRSWIERKYHKITGRNAPKVGVHAYEASDTVMKKIRAIWTGLPGTPYPPFDATRNSRHDVD